VLLLLKRLGLFGFSELLSNRSGSSAAAAAAAEAAEAGM
jgi:hypothetical protein